MAEAEFNEYDKFFFTNDAGEFEPQPGSCYHNCYLYLLVNDSERWDWAIVHGRVPSKKHGWYPLPHAWLENEEFVFDILSDTKTPVEEWYRDHKDPEVVEWYGFDDVDEMYQASGTTGGLT